MTTSDKTAQPLTAEELAASADRIAYIETSGALAGKFGHELIELSKRLIATIDAQAAKLPTHITGGEVR